jgi:hypothetical protein
MTSDLHSDLIAEQEATAAFPVVRAFHTYYEVNGPERADGLIAGLINYKALLDRNGEPFQ